MPVRMLPHDRLGHLLADEVADRFNQVLPTPRRKGSPAHGQGNPDSQQHQPPERTAQALRPE